MSGCPAYLILQREPREAVDTLLHCVETPGHEGNHSAPWPPDVGGGHSALWPPDIGGGVNWEDGMTGTIIVVSPRPQREEA